MTTVPTKVTPEPPSLGKSETLNETIERFRKDLELYSAACLTIRNKDAGMQPLTFNSAQRIVQEKLSAQLREQGRIRAIILKARQEGVSTLVAARFFRGIHLWPGRVAMVIADTLLRAGALFDMYDRYYRNLPHEIAPVIKTRQHQKSLSFVHESELSVRPSTDEEAGRAQTIHQLHASELAYWGPTALAAWVSLMQAIPPQSGEVIVESTAKGAGGLFHDLWQQAESGESGWLAIFLPWWIHEEYERVPEPEVRQSILSEPDSFERQAIEEGIPYEGKLHKLPLEKLAWRRYIITENFGGDPIRPSKDAVRQFQQEYPATAEEAFLVSGACFFDEDMLREMARSPHIKDPDAGRLLIEEETKSLAFRPNPRGRVLIYQHPSESGHYVIGADTAEGKLVAKRRVADKAEQERGGRDYSAAVVLRLADENTPAQVVAELHGYIPPEEFAEQLRLLGRYYSCGGNKDGTYEAKAILGVERSHSSGQTVLRLLREHYRYSPLYRHREINKLVNRTTRRWGWSTDVVSRMPMLDHLGELVRKGQVLIPSKMLINEMTTFVLWDDGKPAAEEGTHDDRVIALAIACQMVREHRHAAKTPLPQYEPEDELTG